MKDKLNKKLLKLLGLGMLTGALFIVLIFGEAIGLLGTLFISILLAMFFISFKDANKFKVKRGFILLIAIILLGITYTVHSNNLLLAFNSIVIFGLCLVYSIHMSKDGSLKPSFEWLKGLVIHAFAPIGEFSVPFKLISTNLSGVNLRNLSSRTKGILFGVILAIPLLLLMISLLASADQVFSSFIGIDLSFFDNISIEENILKLFIWIFTTLYTFSYFYYILYKKKKANVYDPDTNLSNPKKTFVMDSQTKDIMIRTVLVLINILFLFFTFIQFKYLFSASNITVDQGFTYSSYARRGFFELTLISIINLSLIISSIKHFSSTVNKLLLSLLMLNTYVIAFSAIFRMNLYILAYGYTWLRVLSFGFIVLQSLLLLMTLYHVWKRNFDIKLVILFVYLSSYILLNFANVDSMIIKGNVNRYLNGSDLDTEYFYNLSYDSVETLVEYRDMFTDKPEHAFAREKINEVLIYKKQTLSIKSEKWYHFNFSEYVARNQLK